jgi:hypothetical protein
MASAFYIESPAKEGAVPDKEIDAAIANKELYKTDPEKYSYAETEQYL